MAQQGISKGQLVHFLNELGDDEWAALTDPGNLRFTKRFAAWLVRRVMLLLLPVALSDDEAIARFPHLAAKVASWRAHATAVGYKGPVVWIVRAGFTLKKHAPLAGPCYDKLGYLLGWPIRNDEPTQDSIVFWVPRLAQDSVGKSASAMEELRGELRQKHNLPENHCDRFGSIALLFALILAHYKRAGERVPLKFLYAASDTFREDGSRLIAGGFGEGGLGCDYWDERALVPVGFFLLGVEELGTS